jgi:hypothetical protein
MTRIDRIFCTPSWEEHFLHPIVHNLSSSISDYNPLLLTPLVTPITKPIFRFESYWTERPGFMDCVAKAWNKPIPNQHNHLSIFHIKLSRVATSLRAWSKKQVSQGKIAMVVCREIIA